MPPTHRPNETAALVRRACGDQPVATSALAALGLTRQNIRTALAAGTLVPVRRGVVRVAPEPTPQIERAASGVGRIDRSAHMDGARAALLQLADDSVVSHGSAAVIHGLPTYLQPPSDVWVTAPRHGRVIAGTHRRLGSVDAADLVSVDGIPCTSIARTALDLARRRPPHISLVALDAAAARVGVHELRATMSRLDWVYDLKQLSSALTLCSALSESPLESMSRGWMHECGVPAPVQQQWVETGRGTRYRVDFLWPAHKVVGEADGMSKYLTIEDVRAEKRREDDLRRAGYTVVRWTYDELRRTPLVVLERIRQALAS